MPACLLCQIDYEWPKNRRLTCDPCSLRVMSADPRTLSIRERFYGQLYALTGCWEYGTPNGNGSQRVLRLDRRQQPASHVALYLAGRPRPGRWWNVDATCGNYLCVNPDHLEWRERRAPSLPRWAGASPSDAVLKVGRAARAKYQRDYRAKLRGHGVRRMRDLKEELAWRAVRARVEDRKRAEAAAVAPVPVPASVEPPAPATPAPGLADVLAAVRIAPDDDE